MDLKSYAQTSERLKKLRSLAKPKEIKVEPKRKTTAFLEKIAPKKEKPKVWERYRAPVKIQMFDTPFDIADKLHQLPDGYLDKRLIGLDIESLFKDFISRIQKEKLIDISHVGNMQQFIFGKTKYGVHEMMHGGAGPGGLTIAVPTGNVDGVNTVFAFAVAPQLIVVDQGRTMQKVSSDGTVNWTGTTTVTLSVAPNFDIYGF